MNLKTLFGILLLSFVSACATPRYIQPTGEDLVKVTLKAAGGLSYVAFTYDNASNCSGRKMLKSIWDNGDQTIVMPSNAERSITFSWDTGFHGSFFSGCAPTFTFKPIKNRSYEMFPIYEEGECGFVIYEVDKEQKIEVPLKKRQYLQGAFESSPFCS